MESVAFAVEAPIILPFDVRDDWQMSRLFETITERWGRLDFLLHSIAFAPKKELQVRVIDSSAEGFATAMGFLPLTDPVGKAGRAIDDKRRCDPHLFGLQNINIWCGPPRNEVILPSLRFAICGDGGPIMDRSHTHV